MKKMLYAVFAAGITAAIAALPVLADNPIVQTRFTADPAPMVSSDGETLYLFTSHDEPEGGENGAMYIMNDWNLYSTQDMVNWTDLGVPTSYEVFKWAKGDAWAIQTVERNGKYYLYAPVTAQSVTGIGVAVADRPEGPYKDAIGEPLIEKFSFIDPSVYVDEEIGRAFIVWGNPDPYFAELNDDMISFKTQPVKINKTYESFGKSDKENRDTRYEEGPWLQKSGEYCYLTYAGNGIPEDLEYSFCKYDEFLAWVDALPKADGSGEYQSVDGPWIYGDVLMETFSSGTFTNHPGLVDFKDKSYLFYHTAQLPNANGFRRSVAVDVMTYNDSDGKIPAVIPTKAGPAAIAKLNPYERTEAETIAFSAGLESDEYYTVTATGERTDTFTNDDTKNVYIKSIENGDYIKVSNVDFGTAGAGTFTASVASEKKGGSIELRLDSLDGDVIGTLPVSYTAGDWQEKTTGITGAAGTHDLYLVFKGESRVEDLFSFDYWQFKEKTSDKTLAAINVCLDEYKIDTKDGANTANMTVTAVYSDGTTEDITNSEELKVSSDHIIYAGGVVMGTAYGDAVISVSCGGITEDVKLIVKDMDTELTAKSISVSPAVVKLVYGGAAEALTATAEYQDGHTEDVTEKAVYSSADTSIAQTDGNRIIPKAMGITTVTVSYTGELGGAVAATVPVIVSDNMLKNGDFETDVSDWTGSWVEAYSGKNGVVCVAEGTSGGVRSIEQNITGMLDLKPGKQYKMSADIYYTKKADESKASFNIWLLTDWEAADGNQLAGSFGNASVTPGEWTTVSYTFTITDIESLLQRGEKKTLFVIESGGDYKNEYYVDNVTLSYAEQSDQPPVDTVLIDNSIFKAGSFTIYDDSNTEGSISQVWDDGIEGTMGNSWDGNNGVKADITQYVQGNSGKTFTMEVQATNWAWEGDHGVNKMKAFFKVVGSNGGEEIVDIVEGPDSLDDVTDNAVKLTGSAMLNFGDSDTVYLCFTHGAGTQQYSNLTLSVKGGTAPAGKVTVEVPALDENGAYIIASNTTAEAAEIIVYTDDTLGNVRITNVTVPAGASNQKFAVAGGAGDTVYVWNDAMKPYTAKKIL